MWRFALIGLGVFAGHKLAKMGKSRYNFILATVTAALAYKLTREHMIANGEVDIAKASEIRDVEVEVA